MDDSASGGVGDGISQLDRTEALPYASFMSASLDALAQDAMILPADQRLALARQLLESVDLEPQPGAEVAWEAEIARRISAFTSGESKPIPAGEVFATLRQIAPDR
jgi:putative addiction module component (TIGR02574 family)